MVYRAFEQLFAGILFIIFLPLLCILYILVRITSHGPFLYKQERLGKDKKPFLIYKIRTMIEGADKLQTKFKNQNEADGPVFKIRNDPRYTRIGAFLSHSALDELPQLINILRGDMSFVGPRPLPKKEARLVPKKYHLRFSVLPGMTSSWVVQGSHNLPFKKWMELDCENARHSSPMQNIVILLQTAWVVVKEILS